MRLRKQDLRKILYKTNDIGVLGYFVALKMLDVRSPAEMADTLKISVSKCRRIERTLVDMDLINIKGVGSDRVINFPGEGSAEAIQLVNYFYNSIGRKVYPSSPTYEAQILIASDLVSEFGYDVSEWMVDYVIRIRKINMYSLNLVKKMSYELKSKYEQFQKNRAKILEKEDMWEKSKSIEKEKENVDLDKLLNFGIEL